VQFEQVRIRSAAHVRSAAQFQLAAPAAWAVPFAVQLATLPAEYLQERRASVESVSAQPVSARQAALE
jgi:hypothetical protein